MDRFTKDEIDKLNTMYDGDLKRDASSKIRGFLFQDYITIMCLLRDDVEFVCEEYIEDVDVYYPGDKFDYIQVKYYPNSAPNMKEIMTDLYYQFIRLKMLHSTLDATPFLFIHRDSTVTLPTLDEMKSYVCLDDNSRRMVDYPNIDESKKMLKDNVYIFNKKGEQKLKLFEKLASEKSIKEFLSIIKIAHQVDINKYRENLMDELVKQYPIPNKNWDEKNWKYVLLGLAIVCVHERYLQEKTDFDDIKISKVKFNKFITESTQIKTEQFIVSYLIGLVSDEYGIIINDNDLDELRINFLNRIYHNTIVWLSKIAGSLEGQYRLINTLSKKEYDLVSKFKGLSLDERIIIIAEIRDGFLCFIDYMWKIMIDICHDKIRKNDEINDNLDLFNPCTYIVEEVKDYVCFNFPDDRYSNHSVILSRAGKFKQDTRAIVGRMIKASPRPERWLFENYSIVPGKNYYDYSTSDVTDNTTVAHLGRDCFYIECMKCIGVDYAEWGDTENCNECIFEEKCAKEGK